MNNQNNLNAYVRIKVESSSLAGVVICVCGMPNAPVRIYTDDDCCFTNCESCGAVMVVDRVAPTTTNQVDLEVSHLPGVLLNFERSDVFMVLHCICGNETQIYGKDRGTIECSCCRLTHYVGSRLSVRSLAPEQRHGFGGNDELPRNGGAEQVVIVMNEEENLPDVGQMVAAFKRNPYAFWAKTWIKGDTNHA